VAKAEIQEDGTPKNIQIFVPNMGFAGTVVDTWAMNSFQVQASGL
jgi:hypothetical protein